MRVSLGLLALTLVLVSGTFAADDGRGSWERLRPLAGTWKGEGSGFGSVSDVTHTWSFIFDRKFLELRTRSVARREEGKDDEIHEDIGFISRDSDSGGFVFRQFLSEGFVNTYDLGFPIGEETTIEFAFREAESAGGMRARLYITFLSEDEYRMVLDLAEPQKEFVACQQMHMKRVP